MKSKSEKKGKGLVPKLRFPEFRDDREWQIIPLSAICFRITEKVGDKKLTTLSITAGQGFISQKEKFGRDISGAQYKNYIVLKNGEFAYNKGNSKKYPQGCIYKLKEYDKAAAPNAFICFRLKEQSVADFYKACFEANFHAEQLKKYITSGARSDGLLNISANDFFSIKLPATEKKEQQKIADCLSSLDELIKLHSRKLDALKDWKKGLMQKLFPAEGETVPRLRFPDFRDDGEWNINCLNNICDMQAGNFISAQSIKNHPEEDLFPCYGGNGLRGYTNSYTHEGSYSLIGRQGALCGNITFADGKFHATEHAVVVTPKKNIDTNWLYYLLIYLDLNEYATGQAQPGLSVKNLEKVIIKVPEKEKEQEKIANCLSSIDELITSQSQKIESFREHKKSLMQQLFPSPDEAAG